ncbi:hypothetical protein CGRA01v4_13711 [Colletotrichum graminicola]|nr:hypothetical protein CGRA01v4_13711 [Colletotrichum graminicola]
MYLRRVYCQVQDPVQPIRIELLHPIFYSSSKYDQSQVPSAFSTISTHRPRTDTIFRFRPAYTRRFSNGYRSHLSRGDGILAFGRRRSV